MKLLLIFTAALLPMAAETTPQKTVAKKPVVKKAVEESPVPKGAVKIGDFEWRYVDKEGKAWIYRKTPFGVAKLPEEKVKGDTGTSDAPQHASGAPLEIRDMGDSVEFSRRTPFGVSKWSKKKTELNDQEKAAYDSFQSVKLK